MTLDLLVITNLDLRRPRPDATASLGLAWGLDRRGIRWRTAFVGAGRVDPRGFDAVLSWWGHPPRRRHRFQPCTRHHIYPKPLGSTRVPFERRIETRCAELGIPVVNPLSGRLGMRHSHGLAVWQRAGIPCARAQRFTDLSEVTLPFPLVLRADGGEHALDDAFLVRDRTEAEAVVRRRSLDDGRRRRPLSLAMEFRDTRYADGLYRKRRSFVVGDRLLPRQHMLSEVWQVKLKTALAGAASVAEDRRFRAEGEADAELVLRAGRALGPEIVALDYTPCADGSYLFWEGNPIFGMAGLGDDERSLAYRAMTGRSRAECEEEHLALGLAIADLVIRRVEERGAAGGGEGPSRAAGDR